MKNFSCATIVLAFVLVGIRPLPAQVQGQWTTVGIMQSDREFNAQVPLAGGKALAAGGVDNNNNVLASAEIYSPGPGTWTLTGRMAEAREYFPAVVLTNGKVLVSGGLSANSAVLSDAELYDPTSRTWSSAGSLSVARFAHTATLLTNGQVLVAGGCTTSPCLPDTAVSEIYDPASNRWSTTGSLNTARDSHTAVRLKTGKVLAIGGSAGTSCELFDPSKGTWSSVASLTTIRYNHATSLLSDGKVLVSGGRLSRSPMSSAEVYDPTQNTWTLTGSMTTGRYGHTATLLGDGTVLVAGGWGQPISCGKACTSFIQTAKTDIYNEAAGTFTATVALPRAVANHSTTLLSSGRALTSGGDGYLAYCCYVVNNAEFFTPLTMTFSASSLNFGLLEIGLTSASQTVIVANVSSHSATLSSITASGDFSQTNTCLPTTPATLNAGEKCTITVTFMPNKAGILNGAVTLKDKDPGSPTQTIALTGTGETSALGFTPASLNLGSVAVGSTVVQSTTLTDDGAAPVNITGISISPADGTFTQANECPSTLNVQQTCTVTITFTPPDVFTYNATLSVTNSGGAAATLLLSGTGLDGP